MLTAVLDFFYPVATPARNNYEVHHVHLQSEGRSLVGLRSECEAMQRAAIGKTPRQYSLCVSSIDAKEHRLCGPANFTNAVTTQGAPPSLPARHCAPSAHGSSTTRRRRGRRAESLRRDGCMERTARQEINVTQKAANAYIQIAQGDAHYRRVVSA
jgi:hypothetical protein